MKKPTHVDPRIKAVCDASSFGGNTLACFLHYAALLLDDKRPLYGMDAVKAGLQKELLTDEQRQEVVDACLQLPIW